MGLINSAGHGALLQGSPERRDAAHKDGCAVYEEIYVRPLKTSCSEVYRAKGHSAARGPTGASSNVGMPRGEWSQVFDLGPTSLICHVRGNELTIQVLHLTDGPMREYIGS